MWSLSWLESQMLASLRWEVVYGGQVIISLMDYCRRFKVMSSQKVKGSSLILSQAGAPKCQSWWVLSRQDALAYGLLVTLDQDIVFTKGRGVMSSAYATGDDVRFFVAPPPEFNGTKVCYRRVRGVMVNEAEDDDDDDDGGAVNDPTDIRPSQVQNCLVGIPFAVTLTNCDYVGHSFAASLAVEMEWRERTLEASTVDSFIYKLWPVQEAIIYGFGQDTSFKIPGRAGRSLDPKTKKGRPSISWTERILKGEVLGHIPYDESASFELGVRSHAEYRKAFGPSQETWESFRTLAVGFLFMAATALPRLTENRSMRKIFGAWGITIGVVALFWAWMSMDASHTEVLGGTAAAIIALVYGVLRNAGPISITWAELAIGISTTVLLAMRNASLDWRAFELMNTLVAIVLALASSVVTPSGRRISTTALAIYVYVDYIGPTMLTLQTVDRPASRCISEFCQLNLILESRTAGDASEADVVYMYIAIARLLRPVITFCITLVSVTTMDARRKEVGKAEEVHIVGPLLDATRAKIIAESPSQAASDGEGFVMLLFVAAPSPSGPGAPFLFLVVTLLSVLRPAPGGIGVSRLSMDVLKEAGKAVNGEAGLTASAPVGMTGQASEEITAAGILYRAAGELGKPKFKDSIVLMDKLKDSLAYTLVMLSLLGYVPGAAFKRLAGYAAMCLRVKIFIVPDQVIGTTSIKAACRVVRVTAVGDLDGVEVLSAHLVAGPNHDFRLMKGLTFWEISFMSCRRLVVWLYPRAVYLTSRYGYLACPDRRCELNAGRPGI